ncbi:MAG TPA: Spy/CpxP family protein refolding chaperone [Steroidobacteraceae bacterium]|jgi:protein CpxP|nr:Spy/CpxP family protein refolding chaperone [Steroidobacteraceae bacterium]
MKVIAAVLVSTFVFGAAVAQTSDPSASPQASANATPAEMAKADLKRDEAVEHHIMDLHAQLKVTPAEEPQWKQVAETMRENARELDRAIDKRDATIASATAIDNLNSYSDIAQVHANGVKKLASAFSGLYAVMSEAQKKEADVVFSHRDQQTGKVASR